METLPKVLESSRQHWSSNLGPPSGDSPPGLSILVEELYFESSFFQTEALDSRGSHASRCRCALDMHFLTPLLKVDQLFIWKECRIERDGDKKS
jgi:hypothetical protein